MKKLLNYTALIVILMVNGGAGCFNKNTDPQPVAGHCKKIIVSDDGDETEYEFDAQGRLIKLWGQSVESYYKDNYNFKLTLKDANQTITLDRGKVAWGLVALDDDKNGFEHIHYPENSGKGQKIISLISNGFESGQVVTDLDEKYTYNGNGDCTSVKGNLAVGSEKVLIYTADVKYTNKPTPFANHPFQWLIEQTWSEGSHTNAHLTESAKYMIDKVDDEDYKVNIVRDVIYSYQYDKQGRLSLIQINTQEVITKTRLEDGKTFTSNERKQKTVTFVYEC